MSILKATLARRPKQSHIEALYKALNKPVYERIKSGLANLYGYEYVSQCETYMRFQYGVNRLK